MASYTDLMHSLPDELWIYILKNVSSQDAYNVFREYPHISCAVQSYKAHLLFGKVVPFLTDWSKDGGKTSKTGLLTLPDLKSCRLVCKNWSSEVDLMFEKQDLKGNSWTTKLDIYFAHITHFATFSHQFKTLAGNRNPFPSRTLEVNFSNIWRSERLEETFELKQAANARYWTLLITFLEKFGKHIKHFGFTLYSISRDVYYYNGIIQLKNLAKCLRLMPNLKRFHLLISNLYDKLVFNSPEELEAVMASEFTNLPKVEIASLHFAEQEPKLLDCFLKVFKSVKRVYLEPPFNFEDYHPPPMPTLEVIHLYPVHRLESVKYLNRLAQVAPKLCKVVLHYIPIQISQTNVINLLKDFSNRQRFTLELNNKTVTLHLS